MYPLARQFALMLVVVALVLLAMLYVRGRGKSEQENEAATNALNPNQIAVTKAAEQAVALTTAPVRMDSGPRTIETNGVVHFSPTGTLNVSPRLTGKVTAVYVKVGDHVTPQQPLAEMLSSDAANAVDTLRDAQEQLRLTHAALDTARKQFRLGTPEVMSAQATLEQAHENSLYTKRMLDLSREQNNIGGFTDKPLTDAQSASKQAETQLSQDLKDQALYKSQYDRQVKLLSYGVAARADVETALNTLGKANDAVTNDQEQLRIARLTAEREQKAFNTRLYANQTVRQAETNYQQAVLQERAAYTAVRMAKAALIHDLRQAEHDYATAEHDAHAAQVVLSTYENPTAEGVVVVRAPAAGVITARNINPGQMVDQTGQTPWQMFTIVNSTKVYLDSLIYEQDMAALQVGEMVSAGSDALPGNSTIEGVISYVAPGLDPATHALSVRAELDNRAGLLKDGMYLTATIKVGRRASYQARPVVPLTAVVHDGDSDYVFVAAGGGKYNRRKVTLGEQRGENEVLIAKGLTGNETIVTHGALYLGAGGTQAD
jgi:RND family efflux transporter MFP subunit